MRRGRKIPTNDAFAYYVGMGMERSYTAVARHYGASLRAVQKTAKRECWTERLEAIESAAEVETAEQLKETLVEMRSRHLKTLRAVHGRAVEGLRDHRLDSAMESVRALEIVIKLERLVAGEASNRTDLRVRELQQREEDELLQEADEHDPFEDDGASLDDDPEQGEA